MLQRLYRIIIKQERPSITAGAVTNKVKRCARRNNLNDILNSLNPQITNIYIQQIFKANTGARYIKVLSMSGSLPYDSLLDTKSVSGDKLRLYEVKMSIKRWNNNLKSFAYRASIRRAGNTGNNESSTYSKRLNNLINGDVIPAKNLK